MSFTQTPSKEPQPSPPLHHREPDFYDAKHWETAYRHFDEDAVPTILLFLQDDLTRSRRREAAWLSVVVHLLFIIGLVYSQDIMRMLPFHQVVALTPVNPTQDKDLTFLELPPDLQKPKQRPQTNVMSDQDRIATSKTPRIDPKVLQNLAKGREGPPGPPAPTAPGQPAQPAQQQQQASPAQQQPQQSAQNQGPPQQNPNQTAQLQMPQHPQPQQPAQNPFKTGGYVGSQTTQAAAAVAAAGRRATVGGSGGDFGASLGNGASAQGGLEVLSDTMGVDFGPYLNRVLQNVRQNWYTLIPEVARPPIMKKGKLAIEFAITKDGSVAGMKLVLPSGDVALDRAAWGGITASNPFPPLPTEFKGPYLALRFYFFYNPDASDLR